MSTERISGAEAVVKCLLEEGADLVYGYPGGAIMPIYDELYKYQDKLQHVLTRHEQGAVHASQGFARATGLMGAPLIGMCFSTATGPRPSMGRDVPSKIRPTISDDTPIRATSSFRRTAVFSISISWPNERRKSLFNSLITIPLSILKS